MNQIDIIRENMRQNTYADERELLEKLVENYPLDKFKRAQIRTNAADLIQNIRDNGDPSIMELFLEEYGLSTKEGVALMCLAEALLRVPDTDTIDELIEDKIASSKWSEHLGGSNSPLINASTWALMLTGRVLDEREGMASVIHGAIKRLGEPVIRRAVNQSMKVLGSQFVLGETIESAMKRASKMEAKGYTYSYDMLGEAARTERDARAYHLAYSKAISALAAACTNDDIRKNPGISVKLSALHPRYEKAKEARVMDELLPRIRALCLLAKAADMGLNIDAEEADRLDLSLDIIGALLREPALKGWDGLGIVVQAYGKRASYAIDWLYETAKANHRKIMIRLVKGAYWDTEIKRAQVMGLKGFPVFTVKEASDISYICNAQKLLGYRDVIYPQFATHNAHSVEAILAMTDDVDSFEFQRLHGMGESLHDIVHKRSKTRCRIYAPVGAHEDLLAYLVRRLLENGANSSFVNQIADYSIPPLDIARDPFTILEDGTVLPNARIKPPAHIFGDDRTNSEGWDLTDPVDIDRYTTARAEFETVEFSAKSLIAGEIVDSKTIETVTNPAVPNDIVGKINMAQAIDAVTAHKSAKPWTADVEARAQVLEKIADLYEDNAGLFFALLAREAGKTPLDAVAEIREAVDFLRYYANEARRRGEMSPRGVFVAISPWNFPLAIYTGQIAAALAAGNAVIAKPAQQTMLIGHEAALLFYEAGVPRDVFQLLLGDGREIGTALSALPEINGICFTGSTATAQNINKSMAKSAAIDAPLIAETGGLNAMIVDSTALPEQAVRDILASSFQSAGQRCSALRCLYLQADVADKILTMLYGAMDELALGNPWSFETDVGPIIDEAARLKIQNHIDTAKSEGRLLKTLDTPSTGTFVAPAVIRVNSIADMKEEIFGPVLHVATFKAREINKVISDVNATGYGLTFGLHTRIDDRVEAIVDKVHAGNIYVNRNQIGAVVGSQPFGGEGLSGTGPKAGGPDYLSRFVREETFTSGTALLGNALLPNLPQAKDMALESIDLPGPTGEANTLRKFARAPLLVIADDQEAMRICGEVENLGGQAVVATGLSLEELSKIRGIGGVIHGGSDEEGREIRATLAARDGEIIPYIRALSPANWVLHERHTCVDTTAAGGNASLLADVS